MPYDYNADTGADFGKQVNFKAITAWDKVKGVAGSVLVVLLTIGTIDLGSEELNGVVAFLIAALLALGVKPLGPAGSAR